MGTRVDVGEVSPFTPPAGNGNAWLATQGGDAVVSTAGTIDSLVPEPNYWLAYYAKLLRLKAGAAAARWHCPYFTDFAGVWDYQSANTNATDAPALGPGVRLMTLATGSTGSGIVQVTCPTGFSGGTSLVTDVKLSRWAMLFRFQLPSGSDANSRIMFGLFVNAATKLGFGAIGSISTGFLAPVAGGGNAVYTAGTDLSTKAPDANNLVWGYMYNDLTTVKYAVDNEPADRIICAASTLTAGQAAVPYIIHQPAAGARSEAFAIDKMAIFTEL